MARMKGEPGDEGIYDFVAERPSPAKIVAHGAEPKPVTAATLAYQSKKSQVVTKADPETIKNLYMPMWLLGGGVLIEIVAAFLRGGGATGALIYVSIELILGTLAMLAGILLASRFRGIALGQFWIAVFKLSAIAVAPAAAADLAEPLLRYIPFVGGLIGLVAEFVMYFALLGALFDLDESDTWYCVWVIFLVRLAVYFVLVGALAHWG